MDFGSCTNWFYFFHLRIYIWWLSILAACSRLGWNYINFLLHIKAWTAWKNVFSLESTLYITISHPFPFPVLVHLKCLCHFVVKFSLNGSFGVGTGRSAPQSICPTSAPNAVVPPRVLGRSAPGAGSFRPNTKACLDHLTKWSMIVTS